jgi:uncharacterized delta-60 repeat protein
VGVTLATAIAAGALAVPALAGNHDAGALDRSFGHHGTLVVRDVRDDGGSSVAIGRKGRIVMSGPENVVRLLPRGRLDPSFAGDGIWEPGAQGPGSDFFPSRHPSSVVIQPKGGVAVAGALCPRSYRCDFAVRRLTKRGRLSRSFGDDGISRVSFQKQASVGESVARARHGKLIVGGFGCGSGSCSLEVTRLDRDGSLDRSFGRRGRIVTSIGGCSRSFGGMALDSHHRIVLGGLCRHKVNLARFGADGRVDRSFGDRGRAHFRMPDISAFALAIDSHDRIDAATNGKSAMHTLRVNPSGKLDRSFGNNGIATARYPDLSYPEPESAAIDRRGRIVLGGYYDGFGFTRLKSNGHVDRSFGHQGRVTIRGRHFRSFGDVAVDRRDRIVGVGYANPNHAHHPAAVRLLP